MRERIGWDCIGCGFFAQNHLNAWNDLSPRAPTSSPSATSIRAKAKRAGEKFGVPAGTPTPRRCSTRSSSGSSTSRRRCARHLPLVELALRPPHPDHRAEAVRPEHRRGPRAWWRCGQGGRHVPRRARELPLPAAAAARSPRSSPRAPSARRTGRRISFRTGYDIYAGQPYLPKQERFVLIDLGVHVLDVARVLLGEVEHSDRRAAAAQPERHRRGHRDDAAAAHVAAPCRWSSAPTARGASPTASPRR